MNMTVGVEIDTNIQKRNVSWLDDIYVEKIFCLKKARISKH